jgi:anti-sigma regulatory factor (Ser/Thr protein kinase)
MESVDPEAAATRRRELPATLASIGQARDFAVGVLVEPDVQPPLDRSLVADVQLVVSELVTNAVTHGTGSTLLVLTLTASSVHCSVTSVGNDHAPIRLGPAVPSSSERSGRGLAIVTALADSVEATVDDSTWTVDCEFDRR